MNTVAQNKRTLEELEGDVRAVLDFKTRQPGKHVPFPWLATNLSDAGWVVVALAKHDSSQDWANNQIDPAQLVDLLWRAMPGKGAKP